MTWDGKGKGGRDSEMSLLCRQAGKKTTISRGVYDITIHWDWSGTLSSTVDEVKKQPKLIIHLKIIVCCKYFFLAVV